MNLDINGNETVLSNIQNIISSGHIPHSFLIEGGFVEDRLQIADYIAQSVVCSSNDKPCGSCNLCHLALSHTNPDIIYIGPDENKKIISVENIRKLRNDAYIKPHSADKKVFIIKNAELLNVQAQNSFLKILEEPPQSVVFILLVNSRSVLLNTVISRCSLFILNDIQRNNATDDELTLLAKNTLNLLFDGKCYEILKSLKQLEKDRLASEKFFVLLQNECKNQMSCKDISNYRLKALNNIYYKTYEFIESIRMNTNLQLLFNSAIICYKSFLI